MVRRLQRHGMHLIPAGRPGLPRRQERRLRKTRLIRPAYAESFRCIGSACEDSCCVGWRVDIDEATFAKYQSIAAGQMRAAIDANILRSAESANGSKPRAFAHLKMLPSLRCPFHNADGLCQIQVEFGETYLSRTCASFPRVVYFIDKLEEKTLQLSCPEAARLVLTNPDLLAAPGNNGLFANWDDTGKGEPALRSYFWPIREFAIALMRNRAYPLWQRIFLLGVFSRRLDAIIRGQFDRGFPAFLRDFEAAVRSGSLRASMEAIPADLALQLDMVMRLVQLRMDGTVMNSRLAECLNAFVEGVGYGRETTLKGQSALYAAAHERFYAPFFLKHPHMLENYLVDMIFRRLFPFSTKLFDAAAKPEPAREYALLAIDFALVKGLLIGVAGFYQEAFSTEHVLQTVQSVFKHFEHNPDFLSNAHQLLVSRGCEDARGLTMLLRN
jgi:lysine-N-methylase